MKIKLSEDDVAFLLPVLNREVEHLRGVIRHYEPKGGSLKVYEDRIEKTQQLHLLFQMAARLSK